MSSSPSLSTHSTLVSDSPKQNKVRNLFGKLLPSRSLPNELNSSTGAADNHKSSLPQTGRRLSTESFFSGLPHLHPHPHTDPAAIGPPTFHHPHPHPHSTNNALGLVLSRPDISPPLLLTGFPDSPYPAHARVVTTPSGLAYAYAPLQTIDGRILGLKDFGPVIDAGPARAGNDTTNKKMSARPTLGRRPHTAPTPATNVRHEIGRPLSYRSALAALRASPFMSTSNENGGAVEFHPDFETFQRRTRLKSLTTTAATTTRVEEEDDKWDWDWSTGDDEEEEEVKTPGIERSRKQKNRQGSVRWDAEEVRGWLGGCQ